MKVSRSNRPFLILFSNRGTSSDNYGLVSDNQRVVNDK